MDAVSPRLPSVRYPSLRWVFLLISVTLLVSCREIHFKEPQPKGVKVLSDVPKELYGNYLPMANGIGDENDTLNIVDFGFVYHPGDVRREEDRHLLSDSLVLKKYKGYYFLSIYEKPYWALRVIHKEKSGNLKIMFMDKEGISFNDYLRQLSSEIEIDSVQEGDEMRYLIDPKPNELVDLIEKGYFTGSEIRRIK